MTPKDASYLTLVVENPGLKRNRALFNEILGLIEGRFAKAVARALLRDTPSTNTRVRQMVEHYRKWHRANCTVHAPRKVSR